MTLLHGAGALLGRPASSDDVEVRFGAFDRLLQEALKGKVDAVLFTGDLVGAPPTGRAQLERVCGLLADFGEAGIPLIVSPSRSETLAPRPTPLELLEARGLVRLLQPGPEGALEPGRSWLDLGEHLRLVGLGEPRPGELAGLVTAASQLATADRRIVLAVVGSSEASPGALDSFDYVACGGAGRQTSVKRSVCDPGPLAGAEPEAMPVFLRVAFRGAAPIIKGIASGAPLTRLIEIDMTSMKRPEHIMLRVKRSARRAPAAGRAILRVGGRPEFPEDAVDRRALVAEASKALGHLEVTLDWCPDIRLSSGRWIPTDAPRGIIEAAVLDDLIESSPLSATRRSAFGGLARDTLADLLEAGEDRCDVIAARIGAFEAGGS